MKCVILAGGKGEELILLCRDEDASAIDDRCRAKRYRRVTAPHLFAAVGVKRRDKAEAGRNVELAGLIRDAANENSPWALIS